jgi:hypothetical protein
MRWNEVVRFHCSNCQIILDLCVQGMRETEFTQGCRPSLILAAPSAYCPFCGAMEPARLPDDPIITGP